VERIVLSIQPEGGEPRRLNVRRNLPVNVLLDEVRSKLDLGPAQLTLRLRGAKEPLDPARTLAQHGLKDGAELVLVRETGPRSTPARQLIDKGQKVPIGEGHLAYLEEERTGEIFALEWQPAIVGRAVELEPSMNRLLALDLTGLQDSEYVSRHHACITESGGQYALEALNPRNPTYLNEEDIGTGKSRVLQPGDRVRVGKTVLIFNLRG
jgi:hypothetical protein